MSQGIHFLSGRRGIKDEAISSTLEDMGDAVKRADLIIKGLLDLPRPSQLNLLPDDLNSIIKSALLLVKNEAERHEIEIVKILSPEIPPPWPWIAAK